MSNEYDGDLNEESYQDFINEFSYKYKAMKKIRNIRQCYVCLREFTDLSEFSNHIMIHYENDALEFLRKTQPMSGKLLRAKFKRLNLLKLEKNNRIKFSEKHMAWVLYNFDLEKTMQDPEDITFESIIGSPCMDCKYDNVCSTKSEIMTPMKCKLLENWVHGTNAKKPKKVKNDDCMDTIKQAEFFCGRKWRFNIVGRIEKNKIVNSPNKFLFVDEESTKTTIIVKLSEEHKLKLGRVQINNVILTGREPSLNVNKAKIRLLN